jgi:hypothetical protein
MLRCIDFLFKSSGICCFLYYISLFKQQQHTYCSVDTSDWEKKKVEGRSCEWTVGVLVIQLAVQVEIKSKHYIRTRSSPRRKSLVKGKKGRTETHADTHWYIHGWMQVKILVNVIKIWTLSLTLYLFYYLFIIIIIPWIMQMDEYNTGTYGV